MKNNSTETSSSTAAETQSAAIAVPLATDTTTTKASTNETERRMLLFRLSDAGSRIREESNLIQRTGFSDASARLLRILGETIEEQRLAIASTLRGESK